MFSLKPVYFNQLTLDTCEPDDRHLLLEFNSLKRDGSQIQPYQYQVDVLRAARKIIESGDHAVIVLRNPTGSGKSLAGYAPVLLQDPASGDAPIRAVFMYPTRELVRDQFESFNAYRIHGKKFHDAIPPFYRTSSSERVDAYQLDRMQKKYQIRLSERVRDKYTRADTVADLYDETAAIFTTIDSFYYAISFAFGRNTHRRDPVKFVPFYREVTQGCVDAQIASTKPDLFFFDEFDDYDIHQKTCIEAAICLLCHPVLQTQMGRGKCVILASATPHDETVDRLRRAGVRIVDEFKEPWVSPGSCSRQILPRVRVRTMAPTPKHREFRGLTHLQNIIEDKDACEWLANRYRDPDLRQIVCIGDSVHDCIVFAKFFREEYGFEVGEIHGLAAETSHDRKIERNKRMVVGNRSLDKGIDFDADTLITTAPTGSHTLQRGGRLRGSRERERECILIPPKAVKRQLDDSFDGKEVSRSEFEQFIYHGRDGNPTHRYYLQYDQYRRTYAPIGFLNILWDLVGSFEEVYAPHTASDKRKREVKQAIEDQIFPALYDMKGSIDDLIRRYFAMFYAIPTQQRRERFNEVFMRFRSNAIVDCVVHDTTSAYPYHHYDLDYVARYGNVISEGTFVHPDFDRFVRDRGDPALTAMWNRNGKYIGKIDGDGKKIVPFVTVAGYNRQHRQIYYTLDFSHLAYEMQRRPNKYRHKPREYLLVAPTERAPDVTKEHLYALKYPVMTKGLRYKVKGVSAQEMEEFLDEVNDRFLKGNYFPVFAAWLPRTPRKDNILALTFDLAARLKLPMYDQTAPCYVKIPGQSLKWGILGVHRHALLLHGTMLEQDYFLKKRHEAYRDASGNL